MYEKLVSEAFEAMKSAYAPYSNYHVGACVLCKDGRTFRGVNIENASYGATNCAERSAVFGAYSYGYRKADIEAIAIVSDGARIGTPAASAARCSANCSQAIRRCSFQWQRNDGNDDCRAAADELWDGGFSVKSGFSR